MHSELVIRFRAASKASRSLTGDGSRKYLETYLDHRATGNRRQSAAKTSNPAFPKLLISSKAAGDLAPVTKTLFISGPRLYILQMIRLNLSPSAGFSKADILILGALHPCLDAMDAKTSPTRW